MIKKKTKLSVGIADVALIKALKILIPFICAPYVSRVLGADNIGIYSYTNSIASYFCMLAALGTYSYGKREISRNRDNLKVRSKLFWEIELVSITTTFASLLVWFLLLLFIKENTIYFFILSISICASFFDITWFFEGLEEFRFLLVTNLIIKIIGVVCTFVFINKKEDLYLYFIILCLTTLASNIILWLGLKKRVVWTGFNNIELKIHYKESFVFFIPSIATSVYTILDKTFLGLLARDNYESGCYEQAQSIINMAKGFAFTAITTVMGIRTSYLFMKNKENEAQVLIDRALDIILAVSIGCVFGIAMIAKSFVPLFFGEGFDKVVYLLIVASPILLVIGISDCLGGLYYSPVGKRKISAQFIVIGAITNVCLNIVLIPFFKSVGAIVASIIAESVITILFVKNSCGYCSYNKILKMSYKKMFSGFVMAISMLSVWWINTSNTFVFITQTVVGVSVYFFMLLITKDSCILHIREFIKGKD